MADNNPKPFNRSEFMKLRNAKAKIERELYVQQNPDTKAPAYNQFLRKQSPIISNIVQYNVSYQVNYKEYDHFVLPIQTFTVIGYKNSKSDIENRTMEMIQTSRGVTSNNLFSPETVDMLDTELKVNATPRGMEQIERTESKTTIDSIKRDIEELIALGDRRYIVRDLDKSFKFKNKNGRTGEMTLDMTDFIR